MPPGVCVCVRAVGRAGCARGTGRVGVNTCSAGAEETIEIGVDTRSRAGSRSGHFVDGTGSGRTKARIATLERTDEKSRSVVRVCSAERRSDLVLGELASGRDISTYRRCSGL